MFQDQVPKGTTRAELSQEVCHTKTSREKGVAEYTTRASQPSHLGTFYFFIFIYDDAATLP